MQVVLRLGMNNVYPGSGRWGRAKAIIVRAAAISHAKQERAKFGHFGSFTVSLFLAMLTGLWRGLISAHSIMLAP